MLFIIMFRVFITFTVIVLIWHFICLIFDLPSFILPSPKLVAIALFNNFFEILNHSSITLLEIILSLSKRVFSNFKVKEIVIWHAEIIFDKINLCF